MKKYSILNYTTRVRIWASTVFGVIWRFLLAFIFLPSLFICVASSFHLSFLFFFCCCCFSFYFDEGGFRRSCHSGGGNTSGEKFISYFPLCTTDPCNTPCNRLEKLSVVSQNESRFVFNFHARFTFATFLWRREGLISLIRSMLQKCKKKTCFGKTQ